jgi:hypothetical protein
LQQQQRQQHLAQQHLASVAAAMRASSDGDPMSCAVWSTA